MKKSLLKELVLQSLEHERAGIELYETALQCSVNAHLHQAWERSLAETRSHEEMLREVCDVLEIDPERDSPGRKAVRRVGSLLVDAVRMAGANGDAKAAQLVACGCLVLAETNESLNWDLLGAIPVAASAENRP